MKRVKYWAAQAAVDADFQPNSEVDRLDWLPLPAALDRLTRQTDRDLLRAFVAAPVDTVPVILLRHAEALARKRWDGPEVDRPLTGRGRTDADALVPVLAAYGEAALVSSPFARCVATLKPTVRSTGAEPALEPSLGEGSDPDAGRGWLRQVLKAGRTTVACTHRPVLPELLAESPLGQAVHSGRRALAPAEAWVLHARDGHVVAVDRMKPEHSGVRPRRGPASWDMDRPSPERPQTKGVTTPGPHPNAPLDPHAPRRHIYRL